MRKKLISVLLVLALVFALVPTMALAADWYDVYVNGIAATSENKNDVLGSDDGDGATVTYTPAGAGMNAKLTLNGAALTSINYVGDNTLDIEIIGENTITPTSSKFGIVTWRDNGFDEAENTNASLNISGNGTLTVDLTKTTGTELQNGIFANNNLTITGSDLTITVTTGNATTYNHALRATNITIDGAKVNATSGEGLNSCAISAKNSVVISGGAVTATAGKATAEKGASVGILAEKSIAITGGTITAKAGEGTSASAIAAIENGSKLGKLIVGGSGNAATIKNAKAGSLLIMRSSGKVRSGALISRNTKNPVVISFDQVDIDWDNYFTELTSAVSAFRPILERMNILEIMYTNTILKLVGDILDSLFNSFID